MKKKLIALILAVITIINVFGAILLYSDLITVKAPDTTVKLEVIGVNSDEIIVNSILDITNPNDFGISTKNLQMVISTPSGEKVAQLRIDDGSISPNGKKTFTKTFSIDFNGNNPETLKTSLTGTIAMKSGWIQKTIPISMNVITVLGDIITNLVTPNVNVHVDFGEITQKSVNMSLLVNLYNPNTFEIKIQDISVTAETEKGENVGELVLKGGMLPARDSLNLSGNGTISIYALNAKEIMVNMSTTFTARIADYNKSLPLSVESTVSVPNLKNLLPSELPTFAVIRGDMRFSLKGLVDEISLEVQNPNKIEFAAKDITFTMYRIDSNTKKLLSECSIEAGVFKAENTTTLTGTLVIPYRKLYLPPPGGKFVPDWLEVDITANVTVKGLNNYLWIGLVGYSDMHPFRVDRIYTSPKIIS